MKPGFDASSPDLDARRDLDFLAIKRNLEIDFPEFFLPIENIREIDFLDFLAIIEKSIGVHQERQQGLYTCLCRRMDNIDR